MTSFFLSNRCYGAILSGIVRIHNTVNSARAKEMASKNDASAKSNNYEGLDVEAKKRYDEKIGTLGSLGLGPVCIAEETID